jgi:hypothetical protein
MSKALACFSLLVGLNFHFQASAEGCDQPDHLRNTDTPYSLGAKCLDFKPLSPGSVLPVGSIVYLPITDQGGALALSIDRSFLSKQFLNDLFERPVDDVLANHQLAQKGIVLALSPARLQITIYPSVIVSLRSDILGHPRYRSFVGQPIFTVERVPTKAFASTDLDRISTAFSDVFIQYMMRWNSSTTKVLPDGQTQITGNASEILPPRQLPSIVKD